jgi:hypothetical protein
MQIQIVTLIIVKVTEWSALIPLAMFWAFEELYNFTRIEAFGKEICIFSVMQLQS